jgi:VWFA-related protein
MFRMRYLMCLLLALPLGVPAQEPEPSFRTTSSEVLLDVVVRDKKAHIVRDLRPEEIQVFEDGVSQKTRRFEFVNGHETPATPASTPAPATATLAPVAGKPAEPPSVQELRDVSVVSVVVANLDPRGRKVALDTMHEFVKNELRPNTYVGVYMLDVLTGLRKIQAYTNDPERVASGMERAASAAFHERPRLTAQDSNTAGTDTAFQPDTSNDQPVTQANAATQGPAALINQMTESSEVSGMHDVYQDSMRYLASLRTLVESQAGIPGRKVVLLFSSGLPVHFNTVEPLQNLISTANRSNVSVYAVDTAGFTSQSDMDNSRRMLSAAAAASIRRQRSIVNGGDQTVTPMEVMAGEWAEGAIHSNNRANLAQLAEGTGGALLSDSLDLRDPLRRAMEEVRTHYELSYSPTNTSSDGSFRKITVKVSRPGVTVFARSGYYALPMLNGRQIYPFEMATMKAINTKPQLRQFEFHDAAFQFRPGPARDQLAFVFEAPARNLSITTDKNWSTVHVSVTALIKNEQGQIVDKISKDIPYQVPSSKIAELQRGVVTFTAPFLLPPGRYTIETAAVDRESMKASVRRSSLVVGQAVGFAMSDVAVIRRVDAIPESPTSPDPLETRGAKVTPELLDVISPEANGQVKFYAVAYPPSPIDAPVEVSLEIWRDGQVVVRTPASEVAPDASGAASILASIPMEKLPSGQYETQISFQYKGQKVSRVTTFAVGPGS